MGAFTSNSTHLRGLLHVSTLCVDDGCVDCRKSARGVPTFARSAFHNQVDSALVGGGTASDTTPDCTSVGSSAAKTANPGIASSPSNVMNDTKRLFSSPAYLSAPFSGPCHHFRAFHQGCKRHEMTSERNPHSDANLQIVKAKLIKVSLVFSHFGTVCERQLGRRKGSAWFLETYANT